MEILTDLVVIDDIVPKDYQNWIEQIVINQQTPWYYTANCFHPNLKKDPRNVSGLFHYLYSQDTKQSPLFDALYPIVLSIGDKVKWNRMDKMDIDLFPKQKSSIYHLPHVSNFYRTGWTAIYYINNVLAPDDGDTFIFNQKLEQFTVDESEKILKDNYFEIRNKVNPKKGRLIAFPSNYFHASSYASSADRYTVTINLVNEDLNNE